MKKLFIIVILALIICGCTKHFEKKLLAELPGADRITEMSINYYNTGSPLWRTRACIGELPCLNGSGPSLEEAIKDMGNFDLSWMQLMYYSMVVC